MNEDYTIELLKDINNEYSPVEIIELLEKALGLSTVIEAYQQWNENGLDDEEPEEEPRFREWEDVHRSGDVTTTTFYREVIK